MSIYIAEISGRGIVAFDAANEDEARARLSEETLRRDLHVLQNQGRSLWDGISKINLRLALPNEVETWQASYATAGQLGETDGREYWRVFLVPVVDPSRHDDDDDHDFGD